MVHRIQGLPFISIVKRSPTIYRIGQEFFLRHETKSWRTLFSKEKDFWQATLKKKEKKPRVLIATGIAGHSTGALLESMLAAACTLRGADVHILLCNSILGACIITNYPELERGNRSGNIRIRCNSCVLSGKMWFEPMGLPIHYYEDNVRSEEKKTAHDLAATVPIDAINTYTY